MAQPDWGYAEILRTIGWFMGREQVESILITTYGDIWNVSWHESDLGRDEQTYQRHILEQFREMAIEQRQGANQIPPLSVEEMLRTLGAECERQGMKLFGVAQTPTGYLLVGMSEGKRAILEYLMEEIVSLIDQQRARRQEPNPAV